MKDTLVLFIRTIKRVIIYRTIVLNQRSQFRRPWMNLWAGYQRVHRRSANNRTPASASRSGNEVRGGLSRSKKSVFFCEVHNVNWLTSGRPLWRVESVFIWVPVIIDILYIVWCTMSTGRAGWRQNDNYPDVVDIGHGVGPCVGARYKWEWVVRQPMWPNARPGKREESRPKAVATSACCLN